MTILIPNLIIQFSGWILMRIPTDPDPTDEPRGVSGYTFAFGNEPDLNREIFFWETDIYKARSYTFPIGVRVDNATRIDAQTGKPIAITALKDARVDLLRDKVTQLGPRLENRNWTLTPAGFEPIVPFNLKIQGNSITLFRSAPLTPKAPNTPVWKIPEDILQSFGAVGVTFEPATVGNATGIWDSLQVAVNRRAALEKNLEKLQNKKRLTVDDEVEATIIKARIAQLTIGINDPNDRRIGARYAVERFNFPMEGEPEILGDQQKTLHGIIDTKSPWSIGFWIGGWDPDALSAYIMGVLEIPYES